MAEFDPNEGLARLHAALEGFRDDMDREDLSDAASELIRAASDLDDHLCRGGRLPEKWRWEKHQFGSIPRGLGMDGFYSTPCSGGADCQASKHLPSCHAGEVVSA